MKYILLFAFFGVTSLSFAANFTAVSTGGWNSGATWGNTGSVPGVDYPTAGDAVTIGDFSVFITGAESCASLTMNVVSVSQLQLFAGSLNISGTLSITQLGGFFQFQNFGATVNIGNLIINGSGGSCNFQHSAGIFTVSLISATMSNLGTTLSFTTAANFSITANSSLTAISDATININHSGGTFSSAATNLSYFPSSGGGGINVSVSGVSTIFENSGNFFVSASDPTKVIIDLSSSSSTFKLGGGLLGSLPTIIGGTSGSTFMFNGAGIQTIPASSPIIAFDNLQISNTSGTNVTIDAPLTNTNLLGDLIVDAGSFFSQNLNTVAITGGALNNAGTYTQNAALTASGVITNSGTINQTAAITAIGNITNSGVINASTTIDANGSFTNSGTITSTGCNLTLAGNWNNTGGIYTYSSGDIVTLDGTGTQSLDGNTTWNNLTVNHTGTGVSFASGTHNIDSLFDINAGAVTNLAANVVLVSSPSRTAQMPDIGTGSYTGNMTVERYIAKTGQSFTSLTSPVTGTSLATWSSNAAIGSDSLIFSGFAGSDYPSFSFINTWFYNEGAHGTNKDNGWLAASSMADGVGASNSYKGVYIYMDAVNYKLYATGTPTTGNVSIPLDWTPSSGGALEDGWNLIGNPYPCSVNWNSIYSNTANTDSVINGYLTYSGEYANYAWYDGATVSGSGGATENIPSSQGIWVRSLKGSPLVVNESMKNITDAGFLKTTAPPNMRIFVTGSINSFQDEALIFSEATFNDAFEEGDITKFLTMSPEYAPTLFTKSTDGVDLAFNKVGVNSISIPLAATAGTLAQGIYHLDFAIGSDFMAGACITLEDLHTGTITDLRTDTSYSYTTSDTTTLPRFIIHLVKDINTNTTALTCFGTNDGVVAITGNGITGSSFSLLDGTGNIINTGTASNDSITFNNISGGTYEVSTNYTGGCSSNNTYSITVAEPMQVTADFNLMQDTLYLDQNDILEVANNSSGTNFAWDFGDGNTSTFINPTHTYISPGVYPVMLTSNNDNAGQCSEVTTKNVVVMSAPLSIEEVLTDNSTKVYVRKGYVVVEFDLENKTELEITLIDINGKKITNTLEYISSGRVDLISADVLANGVYIVHIIGNNQAISKKVIIE